MENSLNSKNQLRLFAVILTNLAIFFAVVKNDAIISGDWLDLASDLGKALPAGLGLILISILNAQFSSEAKSRIVFLRWNNPLPGSEAFTRYSTSDYRIDMAPIESEYGPLPRDPRQQNALWYKLFKSIEADPSVMQAHREFLFSRDYTCLSLMLMIAFGVMGFFQIPSFKTWLIYFSVLIIQFIITGRASRNHGRSLVTTVLALKGAGR